ncbi:MAG: hypothetical protein A3A33_04015 [Candidatus Yanofskybacteria bacterium RIFCSPLOWO2_01_FULL_49_25]|uniref:Uncharacterized protein n=1 Tax=Candidatus Yanofskybacteria bacterium RIFCSPLOWO2_01_FULL_49_25 TaxID=1802701 RepID=A0A1F8GRN0_9BACT|nr:MAG: hypothetical protein A3A33_04015 [Candidatus Yanofskybacteria bacterium RIFCSPLOWO2_01_FULL_49_25]
MRIWLLGFVILFGCSVKPASERYEIRTGFAAGVIVAKHPAPELERLGHCMLEIQKSKSSAEWSVLAVGHAACAFPPDGDTIISFVWVNTTGGIVAIAP